LAYWPAALWESQQALIESRGDRSKAMQLDRRDVLRLTGITAGVGAASASALPAQAAAPIVSALGIDATHLGVTPGSPDDQTPALQRALGVAVEMRVPLALMPGVYRVGGLTLPPGGQLVGMRGATRLVATSERSLLDANQADGVRLVGLALDGAGIAMSAGQALVSLANGRNVEVANCELVRSGRHAIVLEAIGGEVSGTTISGSADVAILCREARGLMIARNVVRGSGNSGISILRQDAGDDGTIVTDNRIEAIENRQGGPSGNAIVIQRANGVMIRGNQIRGCAGSAVRGEAASSLQIVANHCSDIEDVALYAASSFEGAIIAHNHVDGAGIGVSVANLSDGGRLAVIQGNILRNLAQSVQRPAEDGHGVGIYVEADSVVSGNVIENAAFAGLMIGWSSYLRDVTVTGNVVRQADIGIAVSVAQGAAVIADNIISGVRRGAIVGMDRLTPITEDLSKDAALHATQLSISGNRID
jgi:uncharacterized secreted repeat protein (TIGR03808 family)